MVDKLNLPAKENAVQLKINDIIDNTTLESLKNVTITSPSAGQSLTYDATNQVWKNTSTTATIAWGGITGTLGDQTDLANALGDKYDASNPEGYTSNIGTVTSVNNTSPDSNGNVTIFIPTKISDLTDDTSTYPIDKADTLTGLTVSITELNYTDGVTSNIQTQFNSITALIPSEATSSNKLADKEFVNSSISTNTANFIGTFENESALEAYSGTVTNNDYAFVVNSVITNNGSDWTTFAALDAYSKAHLTNYDYAWVVNGTAFDLYRFDIVNQTWVSRATAIAKDSSLLNTAYNRYKATVSGSTVTWAYEYTLNNSSFTAVQWAAINSGATTTNIGQITTNKNAIGTLSSLTTTAKTDLVSAINELDSDKQDNLPSQSGQSGKYLTTNGTTISWANTPTEIPSQSGQSGKYLTTNGTTVSWGTPPNDDTKVTQTVQTSGIYPILGAPSGQTTTQTTTANFSVGINISPEFGAVELQSVAGKTAGGRIRLVNPSDKTTLAGSEISTNQGKLEIKGRPSLDGTTVTGTGTNLIIDPYAKTITGGYSFDGNAATATTATKATQDGSGNTITSTYVNLTGTQTITGAKTFSNANSGTLILNNTSSAARIAYQNNGTTKGFIGVSTTGMPGFWDSAGTTAVQLLRNSTWNTAVGSATKPCYIDANGIAQTCTYTLEKSVPSNAVFTDTDTKVTQNVTTGSNWYPALLCPTANATTDQGAKTSIFASTIKVNPAAGAISVTGANNSTLNDGGILRLEANPNDNTKGGIIMDNSSSLLRIYGINSADNTTKVFTGNKLLIDPFDKSIKGNYTFDGTTDKIVVTDHSTNNATYYPLWATGTGNLNVYVTTSKLKFNPSSGVFEAPSLLGTSSSFGNSIVCYRDSNGSDTAVKFSNKDGTTGYIGMSNGGEPRQWLGSDTSKWHKLIRVPQNQASIGSTTQPIYVDNNGTAQSCTYTLEKSVPSDAVFTDTKVTQTVKTDNANYPVLLAPSGQTTTQTTTSNFASDILFNPSSGSLLIKGASTTSNIEGAQIDLKPNKGSTTYGGISLDNYDSTFRIFGIASADGTTKTGVGTALVIDPWAKSITGKYSFTGGTGYFEHSSYGSALEVKRVAAGSDPAIKFSNNDGVRGYLGIGTGADSVAIPKYTESNTANWYPLVRMANTSTAAIGSSTQPVYIAKNGIATACNTMVDVTKYGVSATSTTSSCNGYQKLCSITNSTTATRNVYATFNVYVAHGQGYTSPTGKVRLSMRWTNSDVNAPKFVLVQHNTDSTVASTVTELLKSLVLAYSYTANTADGLKAEIWVKNNLQNYTRVYLVPEMILLGDYGVTYDATNTDSNGFTYYKTMNGGSTAPTSGYTQVTLTDNSQVTLTDTQTITGAKTFSNANNNGLIVNNTNSTGGRTAYQTNGTITGSIGVSSDKRPAFWVDGGTSAVHLLRNAAWNTATGSATQPVYINQNGVALACDYSLEKSVPSNAVFTDEKVTNTLNTTTKAYITGTTSSTTNTGGQIFDTGVFLTTTAGELQATQMVLSGSAGINFTGSDPTLKKNGSNVLRINSSGSTIISTTASSGQQICFRPQGDGTAATQVTMTHTGMLGLSNNSVGLQYNSTTQALEFTFA